MGTLSIETFEYNSDATMRAAFQSNGDRAGTDRCAVMTADNAPAPNWVACSINYGTDDAWKPFDSNTTATYWYSYPNAAAWISYDFGPGMRIIATGYGIHAGSSNYPTAWTFEGSNDYSSWTTLDTRTGQTFSGSLKTYSFSNSNGYRYYRLNISAASGKNLINNIEIYETAATPCQVFSESTIKTTGSYALKVVATTAASGCIIRRYFSSIVDLSAYKTVVFDMRSTITGSNVTFKFFDRYDNSISFTPNILAVDTYQQCGWPIGHENKDFLKIIAGFQIVIADATNNNTFYVDNMYAEIGSTNYLKHCRKRPRVTIKKGVSKGSQGRW